MTTLKGYIRLLADIARILAMYALRFVVLMILGVIAVVLVTQPAALMHPNGWWTVLKYILLASTIPLTVFVGLTVKYSAQFARKLSGLGVSLTDYGSATRTQRAGFRQGTHLD